MSVCMCKYHGDYYVLKQVYITCFTLGTRVMRCNQTNEHIEDEEHKPNPKCIKHLSCMIIEFHLQTVLPIVSV